MACRQQTHIYSLLSLPSLRAMPPASFFASRSASLQNYAPLSPVSAALTSHPQFVENTSPLSPLFATLTSCVARNSLLCHSYKNMGGWGRQLPGGANQYAKFSRYLITSLLHCFPLLRGPCPVTGSRITGHGTWTTPSVPLRPHPQSAKIELGTFCAAARETSPLPSVSKQGRADIRCGDARTPPLVASRSQSRDRTRKKAWVHRSITERSERGPTRRLVRDPARAGKAGSVRMG